MLRRTAQVRAHAMDLPRAAAAAVRPAAAPPWRKNQKGGHPIEHVHGPGRAGAVWQGGVGARGRSQP